MAAIEVVLSWLRSRPDVSLRSTEHSVAIEPHEPSGFHLELIQRGAEHWTVYFEGWHEEFSSENGALRCLAFGLSEECRLRIERRGNIPVKWSVESREDGTWISDSEVGLFHPFFWRPRSVEYRSNRVFATREPPAT